MRSLGEQTAFCANKLERCVRLARDCSRDSWQHAPTKKAKREYKRLAKDSIDDARYWSERLHTIAAQELQP